MVIRSLHLRIEIKETLRRRASSARLPEPQSGLAGGITVGDKRAMGKDLTQEFRTVSLVHIVVLSGYNITVVINALFRVLSMDA
jgi:predicted membrane metal-binding protein